VKKTGKPRSSIKDVNLMAVEEELRRALGTKVAVDKKGSAGHITLAFYSDKEFQDLVGKLSKN